MKIPTRGRGHERGSREGGCVGSRDRWNQNPHDREEGAREREKRERERREREREREKRERQRARERVGEAFGFYAFYGSRRDAMSMTTRRSGADSGADSAAASGADSAPRSSRAEEARARRNRSR